MKDIETITYTEGELPDLATSLLKKYGESRIWAFDAPMGAGKTTLIKELCHALGVEETTSSPTFAIINVYRSPNGEIYHFDCYRFETLADAYNIGAEEYLDSGSYCFVEWPEVIASLLPDDALSLKIEIVDDRTRRLTVRKV
ncbi:tRNA (adenosine(37)-N6)-threonylcarbamoyltransferase complex ATPase subunit type 1 TsaE [Porphyromonas sp.]|uniref:tRNA (adenosine(37)-N6)-threonylcarbamoyltransferase complex ATPase subunit type 1 TsaE n=1 Tax=Porphyromonas sp. TaxID=1924944 RepID=UPI0026DC5A25|nr:tRNA (adenosine(37)-N6)-threonylcarbamoyltransferase complex ATPase subunit type 1 TsaE [Porphyromonas sp.]MDO4771315.1 tRNA (adenosine(37)-N6)-threonylcarbamoyltransferase complex ATPase subunit type 1 TsaE [Porphyromonas sp.]